MGDLDNQWKLFFGGGNGNAEDNVISSDEEENEQDLGDVDNEMNDESLKLTEKTRPVCSELYISTKTKIAYLNSKIDIYDAFWKLPIIKYYVQSEGPIKKQMKFSTSSQDELNEIESQLKNQYCVNQYVIEHIENPNGRIKFKDQRKISIGISKKDITSYRIKQKRAFFNCFVVIFRVLDQDDETFKEMHVKVFNTGKLEMPGIKSDVMMKRLQTLIIQFLEPLVGDGLKFQEKSETVLINSNFRCGYYINRDVLYRVLKFKYRINCNYDACSYPGIQCKFFYDINLDEQTGQPPVGEEGRKQSKYLEISFMIFRTGSVLVVGKCNEDVLFKIYDFIKKMLETEYMTIGKCLVPKHIDVEKKRIPKIRRKTITISK